MSPEQIGFIFGSGWVGLKLSTLCVESMGRSIYDIRHIKVRKQQVRAKTKRQKHLSIAVVIQTNGQTAGLIPCLESIASQKYPKCEAVILSDHLSRTDSQAINRFKKKHAKIKVRVVPASSSRAQQAKSVRGDVALYITADLQLDDRSLERINAYFLQDRSRVIVPATKVVRDKSMVGLVQEYESLHRANDYALGLSGDQSVRVEYKHAASRKMTNLYYTDDIVLLKQPLATYRKVVAESVQTHEQNMQAALDVSSGFRRTLSLLTGLSGLLEPFAIAYFVYLGTAFDRPEPLVLAWALGVFSLVFYAWSDKHTTFIGKLRLMLLAPVGYIETLVLSLTRTVSVFAYLGKWLKRDWSSWQPALIAA